MYNQSYATNKTPTNLNPWMVIWDDTHYIQAITFFNNHWDDIRILSNEVVCKTTQCVKINLSLFYSIINRLNLTFYGTQNFFNKINRPSTREQVTGLTFNCK